MVQRIHTCSNDLINLCLKIRPTTHGDEPRQSIKIYGIRKLTKYR